MPSLVRQKKNKNLFSWSLCFLLFFFLLVQKFSCCTAVPALSFSLCTTLDWKESHYNSVVCILTASPRISVLSITFKKLRNGISVSNRRGVEIWAVEKKSFRKLHKTFCSNFLLTSKLGDQIRKAEIGKSACISRYFDYSMHVQN